ncbi:MAG: Clp protease N-terminal domain-containing protein, partial [Bacteroidales bacterium]
MNMNNLTIKTQEAIANAQMIAVNNQQQKIDNLHILKAILDMDENVIPFLIKKQEGNPKLIEQIVDKQIQSIPKVSGGDIYLSNGVQTAIQKAVLLS